MGQPTTETKYIGIPYKPREYFVPFHERKQRFALILGHRRAGKTVATVADVVKDSILCPLKNPRGGYLAPYLKQAKAVAWGYLCDFVKDIPGVTVYQSELKVTIPRMTPNGPDVVTIQLYGADNAEAMRGLYFDVLAVDEPADIHPRVFPEVVRPALADRKGKAIFIGTPKGRNGFYDIYENALKRPDQWYVSILKATDTGILDDEELQAAREMMTEDMYNQEFMCSFDAAVLGAFWGTQLRELEEEGRVTNFNWYRELPMLTAWDIGMDDTTFIWKAQFGLEKVYVYDFYENHNQPSEHYANELLNPQKNPWTYGMHYFPHDVKVREWGSGKTRLQQLESLGIRSWKVIPALSHDTKINAVRMMLPHVVFHERCRPALNRLKLYRAEFDEVRKTYRSTPYHDQNSHPADAFAVLALAWREAKGLATKKEAKTLTDMTFDELMEAHDEEVGQ